MRVIFKPHDQKTWEIFFHNQTVQTGHGMLGFHGTRYQRGAGIGNIFGGLLRTILPMVKSAGKAVGRQALKTGMNVASDVIGGRNIGESFDEHAKAGTQHLLNRGVEKLKQGGENVTQAGRRKRRKNQSGRGVGVRPEERTTKRLNPKKSVIRKKRQHSDQLGNYYSDGSDD